MGLFDKLRGKMKGDNNADEIKPEKKMNMDINDNTLLLQGVPFLLCTDNRNSAFYISGSDDDDRTLEISVDATFQKNDFEGNRVGPYLVINPTQTGKKNLSEIKGMSFEVKNLEEADEREDTLYIFEHEPLACYELTVLELTNDDAHIQCTGVAITDGYSKPYKTSEFTMNCHLPVITNKNDWAKYGL